MDYAGKVYKHKHKFKDNFWYIVDGKSIAILDDEEIRVKEGDSLIIPKNTFYEAKTNAKQRTKFLQVQSIVYSKE